MESIYPEICSISDPFEETIGLYVDLMSRLIILSMTCVVFAKLTSV